jgi:teichoic acid transport system ATP-binding protein
LGHDKTKLLGLCEHAPDAGGARPRGQLLLRWAIGVVGHNGSGKSTLLRAIAGLTPAAEGSIWADSNPTLLGVNAAMINDLSGDRNVILGGLALGLTPEEIRAQYDGIVDFAGIGDFIDLPMRTYSSGMQARLRFAIAASVSHRVLRSMSAGGRRQGVQQRSEPDRELRSEPARCSGQPLHVVDTDPADGR